MTKKPLIKLEGVSKHYVKNKMSIDIFDELDLTIKENVIKGSPSPLVFEWLGV